MGHPFEKEVLVAQSLAKSAGEMAKALKAGSRYELKNDGEGPVSDADIRADEIISEGLQGSFPHDLVISEERAQGDTLLPQQGRVWLVDPIDGTSDYIIGGIDYSVMIGLLVDGIPTIGVIYGPETGEMWTGVIYHDTIHEFRFAERLQADGKRIALNIRSAPEITQPVITISKHHPSKTVDRIAKFLNPTAIIRKGSLGLKIALIADGKADFYAAASRRIKVWDTCGPFALLKASGGDAYTFGCQKVIYGPTCTHTSPFFAVSYRFESTAVREFSQRLGEYATS